MSNPASLVILGASGDLTHRLLLPGLGTLLKQHSRPDLTLVGAAFDEMGDEKWKEVVQSALSESGCPQGRIDQILATTRYIKIDVTNPDELRALLDSCPSDPVLYFALPPAITMRACEALATMEVPPTLRLGLEKPFGADAETAHELNQLLTRIVPERQIFRVDHFLGKSTVLNLLGLRFANRLFEPIWNAQNIDHVVIVTDETLALEGRAGYYDKAGAMKDMIQSHLLLVLAMFAMEEPARVDELELRDLMAHVLRATELWSGDPMADSRRARYTAGRIGDRDVPNYVDEEGVTPENKTETLAELKVRVKTSRWADVPITLRSGKALGDARNGITVILKPVGHLPEGFKNTPAPNVISIGMKPENIAVGITTNAEGDVLDLEDSVLFTELGSSAVRPYGEILEGILDGDPLLSVRGDIAEQCWRIISPVLQAWQDNKIPMDEYRAGSSGPANWM
ncbi:MAG: glucose-6-phosphate dehydrogenase [Luteococcus sp.]|uniref:glucose-6-phosphate dehydrogenase n=1 Tax=Luteococcus sp. TaxID=1969402 RepID=UPI002649F652|nr:glucose-6-phosphate dehydrogenase [Luteococcus sp.]MDN5564509.1 glucose-6-phosphate dehydrogenase [Luteococcus sp.]